MKIALMFSGQGAQVVGMGKDLYNHYLESKRIFDEANEILPFDVKQVCFEDPDGLQSQTRYTQGALFTTSVAAFQAFRTYDIKADAVLGFSLGEYSALVASGAMHFRDALRLVEKRALYMDACSRQTNGGMAAVIGLEVEIIKEVCEKLSLEGQKIELANDNCPGQVVISGEKSAIEQAILILKERGAKRVMPLNVSGAFHSSLMDEASQKLEKELPEFEFFEPNIAIVGNVSADYMNKEQIIQNIPLQMTQGVRFRESILKLIDEGFDTFIEIGVKKTLCSFVNKISKEVQTLHVEDKASLDKVVETLGGSQDVKG